jgi:hypothetical protein
MASERQYKIAAQVPRELDDNSVLSTTWGEIDEIVK